LSVSIQFIKNQTLIFITEIGIEFYWALPPIGTGTMALDPTFGSFYLDRISFTLGESVSLVKVFRLFRLERIVLVVFSVWTQEVDV
jgi:hypothetical protein